MTYRTRLALGTAVSAVMALLLTCAPGEEVSRPNIVLIVVDALRPDHLGCYGYDRPTSPVIDALGAENILFENAISHAPWTKTSFATMMTSLYPHQHGVTGWDNVMPDSLVTLPEMLRDAGYSTMAVVNMLGIADRFRVLEGVDSLDSAAKSERDAVRSTDDAIRLMRGSSRPFFIIIHYFDVHWPYRPPVEYIDLIRRDADPDPLAPRRGRGAARQKPGGEGPGEDMIRAELMKYDGCIRFVDENIGRIVAFLAEAGIEDETALIITADHGEAFWEHGFGSHGYDLHEESIRVPLVLRYPAGFGEPSRISVQVGLVDLLPTILDFAGLEDDEYREGASLGKLVESGRRMPPEGSLLPGDMLLAESSLRKAPDSKCIRSNEYKALIEPATSLISVFDLAADPGEKVNMRDSAPEFADSLVRSLLRVPGSRVNGWRLGFTGGAEGVSYGVKAGILDGGRITVARRLVSGGDFSLDLTADSTGFEVKTRVNQQQIVLFDVFPRDSRVSLEVSAGGEGAPSGLAVGASGTQPVGRRAILAPQDALGLPEAFESARRAYLPGAFVWWLPGGEVGRGAERTDLTPEEVSRLKSLGYIQ